MEAPNVTLSDSYASSQSMGAPAVSRRSRHWTPSEPSILYNPTSLLFSTLHSLFQSQSSPAT